MTSIATDQDTNPNTDLIQIREIQDKDLDILGDLNGPWEFQKKGRAYLEWLTSFRPPMFFVATLSNEIIGYYGTHSVPLKIRDKVVDCYTGEIFVHPGHRKKWYSFLTVYRLIEAVRQEAKKRKAVVYGVPRRRLLEYYTQETGTRYIKSIARYVYILNITSTLALIVKNKGVAQILGGLLQPFWRLSHPISKKHVKDIQIKQVYCFDKRFNQLWQKASQMHPIIFVRSAEYLNWRYLKEPGGRPCVIFTAEHHNEILGYIILKCMEDKDQGKGHIVDLLDIQDRKITKALLLRAFQYFKDNHADKIEFHLSNCYYEKTLRSVGFIQRPHGSNEGNGIVADCYQLSTIDEKDFYNPKNWFITTIDIILA